MKFYFLGCAIFFAKKFVGALCRLEIAKKMDVSKWRCHFHLVILSTAALLQCPGK